LEVQINKGVLFMKDVNEDVKNIEDIESDKQNEIKSFDVDPDGVLPEGVKKSVEEKLFSKVDSLNKDFDKLSKDEKDKFSEEALKDYFLNLNKKEKYKKGLLNEGYRPGFTKPTIESRKKDRRKKNKQSRLSRRSNRR